MRPQRTTTSRPTYFILRPKVPVELTNYNIFAFPQIYVGGPLAPNRAPGHFGCKGRAVLNQKHNRSIETAATAACGVFAPTLFGHSITHPASSGCGLR